MSDSFQTYGLSRPDSFVHGIPQGRILEFGVSQVVQWLRLHASTSGGMGSIPGLGTKIPHAAWCGQKKSNK